MISRQMKEREESLLSMLGYVKFIHEQQKQDSQASNLSTQNGLNKITTNQQQQNRLKQKRQLSEKYLKITSHNKNMPYDTVRGKDNQEKSKNLKQYFQSHLQTPKNEFLKDEQFQKELPLIKSSDEKIFNSFQTPKQSNSDIFYHSSRLGNNKKYTSEDQQNSQSISNSEQIIQEIFINQQLKQRIPTPQLAQQVTKFFKSRKFLLTQLTQNSFTQQHSKVNNLIGSDVPQKISSETNRAKKTVFKDFKLNVQEISNSLSRAKMLSAQQLSENRFSLASFTSSNMRKKSKVYSILQNQTNNKNNQQSSTAYLLKPLNFKQNLNIQDNKNKTLEGIKENQEFLLENNNLSLKEIFDRQQSNKITNDSELNISNEINENNQQKQDNKINNLEVNRWVLKHPIQPILSEQFNQNENKTNNNNNQLMQAQKSLGQQFNVGQFLNNKINNKFENQQNGVNQIGQFNQKEQRDMAQDEHFKRDKQNKQKAKTFIYKFDIQKQDQLSNKNSQQGSSKNIKSSKNIQFFESNNQKNQSLKKYQTSQLIQYGESNHKEKKAKPYLDHKQINNNNNQYDFLDQFQQQYQPNSIQSSKEIKNGASNQIKGAQTLGIQTSNLQQVSLQKNKNPSIKSPQSTNSPIKRKLFQQQIHEDNYNIMNSTLIQELNQNEVLSQYIQQSGYSIEMFAFYMIKLYNFCIYSTYQKKDIQNSSYESNDQNDSRSNNYSQNLSSHQANRNNQYVQEFPTLKVNEQTFISVLEIFVNKMKELCLPPHLIREFQEKFLGAIKSFMPQTLIDDFGGLEKIKVIIQKLLEHLCYENGIIPAFDGQLVNLVSEGVVSLLRSDNNVLQTYLARLKNSPMQISNAEFYHIKIGLGMVMQEMQYPQNLIFQIVQRVNKQRGYFTSLNNFSKDSSFRNAFIQSISKNKKIVGYFLDPSSNIIQNFYDELFQTLFGYNRFVDLIDYFEHKLKTNQIPLIMIEEIHKAIIEAYKSTQADANNLAMRDISIKIERIKQKADLISYQFLNIGMSESELVEQLIEWCEYALININLPDGMQEDSIIKPEFLQEYLFLVLSEDDQLFSIYDLDYSVTYHNIINFDYCFNMWLSGIQDVLLKNDTYPKENIKELISYLRMNSLLQNS
ncbi:hypothetical protein TTHERM_00318620 (macronuclear) [Tetrahymena thermophila SB210]|uniref:Uncharacterized protein n=1 Tax=Tetrahymena thermophila (strain SB210) TaxID=312017 RepID=I7MG79_TETTS|nr:hypothetical protein TTHERM_00318620 [Tetrahymena thermophila SB210]EAS01199.2 hypothetical protein TTHERM_00318620 [Tetrahymena thermophila SB210]|eukprot:XP_001021444.2 hypothetical protein TTHERM_00318620 [Tetrahymena thermophila SB210]